MPTADIHQNALLIVDDTPQNLRLLFHVLNDNYYKVLVAENGEVALKMVQEKQPDMILLDIIMPGINGFETCYQLKNNPQTKDIPIIFITIKSDIFYKIKGFELGAVDYITIPFNEKEVLARIKTHLTVRKLQKKLKKQNDQLMQLNQEKNELLGVVAHNLKNPLSVIQHTIQFVENQLDTISKQKMLKSVALISNAAKSMIGLIKNILDTNAIESGKITVLPVITNFLPILQSLITQYSQPAQVKNIKLAFQHQAEQYLVKVDPNLLYQILENLLSNAIKYSPCDQAIDIRIRQYENTIRCEIQDKGPGLSDSDQQKLFKKFIRLTTQPTGGESSTGLGLFIVKKLIEMMNGSVWCESQLGKGATFIVEFPVVHDEIKPSVSQFH